MKVDNKFYCIVIIQYCMKGSPRAKVQERKPKIKGLKTQKKIQSRVHQDQERKDREINAQVIGLAMCQNDQADNLGLKKQENLESNIEGQTISSLLRSLKAVLQLNLSDPNILCAITKMIDNESLSITQEFEKYFEEVPYKDIIDGTQTDEPPFYFAKQTKKNSTHSHKVKKSLTSAQEITRYFHTVIKHLQLRSDVFYNAFQILRGMIRSQGQSNVKHAVRVRVKRPRRQSTQPEMSDFNYSLSALASNKKDESAGALIVQASKNPNLNCQIAIPYQKIKQMQLQYAQQFESQQRKIAQLQITKEQQDRQIGELKSRQNYTTKKLEALKGQMQEVQTRSKQKLSKNQIQLEQNRNKVLELQRKVEAVNNQSLVNQTQLQAQINQLNRNLKEVKQKNQSLEQGLKTVEEVNKQLLIGQTQLQAQIDRLNRKLKEARQKNQYLEQELKKLHEQKKQQSMYLLDYQEQSAIEDKGQSIFSLDTSKIQRIQRDHHSEQFQPSGLFQDSHILQGHNKKNHLLSSFVQRLNQSEAKTIKKYLYNDQTQDAPNFASCLVGKSFPCLGLFKLANNNHVMGFFTTGIVPFEHKHLPESVLFCLEDEGYFFLKNSNPNCIAAKYFDETLTLGNLEFQIKNASCNQFKVSTNTKQGNYFFIPNLDALLGKYWSKSEFVAFSAMEIYEIAH